MKKVLFLFVFLLIFGASILFITKSVFAENLPSKLKGKILLQVELKGEAWYVSPADGKRYSMGRPNDAFNLMRKLGVGISNKNLEKIQIANENLTGQDSDNDGLSDMVEYSIGTNKNNKDSDRDGFDDKSEVINGYNPKGAGKIIIDSNFAKQQSGKILLQVETKGEAWYVNPENNKRYFLGRPTDAFNLMRKLGLGISNNDLNKIAESDIIISSSSGLELDVRIPKSIYNVGESLKGAEYYLKYSGEPFKGMVLYSHSTEGLIKKSYSSTRGIIKTGDFDNPETLPGLKVSMYSIKPDGTPNPLDCDGAYVYSISVYDCTSVDKVFGTDDCGEGGWPPKIDTEDIVAKVSPLKTKSKIISVVCSDKSIDCCSNWAYRCSFDRDCIGGYKCEEHKCITK